jgi:ectoine hydroxylase-related dioxygenase (phytanoyl-CoA dioxygenase family)
LNEEQLDFWDKNGYIILRNAVSQEDCDKTIGVICDFIEIDRNDPATWYNQHPARQGIMVQLFQHPILDKNRNSAIIRAAHEQLWNRTDVWVNADRVGFNPPETERWKFPGPRLHWDTKLKLPIPFNVQGILYLADTAENQGAFSLVPGFQHRIDDWLTGLNGKNPYNEDLHALGCIPIAANAGDFIIWHHALPHGSSANTSDKPRFVQYFTYAPVDAEG